MVTENMQNKEVFYSKNYRLSPTGTEMLRGELNAIQQFIHVSGYLPSTCTFIAVVSDTQTYWQPKLRLRDPHVNRLLPLEWLQWHLPRMSERLLVSLAILVQDVK
jgi:hypothetical protein